MKKLLILLFIPILFIGCKKAEKGDKGDPGMNGANGNSNVKVTTLAVSASDWLWDNTQKYNYIIHTDLMQDVSGAVMIYKQNTDLSYSALPLSFFSGSNQYTYLFNYDNTNIKIMLQNSSLTNNNPTSVFFKIVYIPPAILIKNPKLNLKEYKEVEKLIK